MKNVKTFDTHAEYNAYITGSTKVLPNVSYCKDNDESHITARPKITVTIDVTQTTGATRVLSEVGDAIDYVQAVIIDGVKQNTVQTGYTFSTTGEHTIKYLFNDGVDYIPSSMFDGEYDLLHITSAKMSSGIKEIGEMAFNWCFELRQVVIPDNVITIGADAFAECISLTSVVISNNVTTIGIGAFGGCSGLTSIIIPSSVTSIGKNVFSRCSSLTSIIVDSNNIAYDSREDCNAIIETSTNTLIAGCRNTVIPNSVRVIGSNAFNGCSGLTSIDIPNGVTSISQSAFNGCSGLTYITIPNSVTSIGDYAFNNCSGLTSVTIPNSVTSIGDYAFYDCRSLSSVTIGSGVTSIGSSAFQNCTKLERITTYARTAPTIKSATFKNVKTGGVLEHDDFSNGYDVWMQNTAYYLRYYNWDEQIWL